MNLRLILALLSIIALTGCESMSDRVNDRFAASTPQTREFNGPAEDIAKAARKAFRRLDFTIVRSSPARIEAASTIHKSAAFGDSRQVVALLCIRDGDAGKTVLELSLTQDVVSSSIGGTQSTAIREHEFFGIYFAMLQQVLSESETASGDPK